MGLFNAHAVAQQRADRIATLLQSFADGQLDTAVGEAPAPGYERLYDSLRALQRQLREQRAELQQVESLEAGLAEMSRQHEAGWIDQTIPAERLEGRAARIAKGVNELVAAHIAVKMKVVSVVTAYGQGNFEPLMDRLPGKKAQITEAIDGVRERLRGAAEATSAQLATAAYNARIKSALDNVSANVMIADNDLNIIYMNRTVSEMLGRAEADIRKQLPNFDAGRLMGANIDVFHKNPAHQRHLLANLTGVHKAELNLGGRRFSLDVVPVFNDANERLGSAVQWTDRTEEHRAEQEVSQLVQAAAAGDFSKRVEEAGKEGFFLRLAKDLNSLVDTADRGLRDVSRMLGALAQGDLTQRIEADYQGTFGQLKDFSNETALSLSRMLGQIREAADTINTAASEIASGNAELSARTEQQASSLEETASSMEELTSTVKLNAENARQANSLAANASEVATQGGTVVQKVVSTMSSINESARKIADIIGVIDGIAFQTNILALNAAVEAARAGEQGRGFAVVAGEVRTLAQRRRRGQGDQDADLRLGGQGGERQHPGGPGRTDHERHRGSDPPGHRHHVGDRRRLRRAEHRHRRGEQRGLADGRHDPAERRAGGGSRGRRRGHAGAGGPAQPVGGGVQAGHSAERGPARQRAAVRATPQRAGAAGPQRHGAGQQGAQGRRLGRVLRPRRASARRRAASP